MAKDRFVNNTLSELEEANRSPIFGYEDSPLLTLEEAVEKITPLISRLLDYVATAKKSCNRHSTLLTWDQSAAIYLYSMATPFFSRLNDTLRAENRHALKPWFGFLKLFMMALEKLPSTRKTVWRGVSGNVSSIIADGDLHIWYSVNSCSMDLKVVEQYLTGTDTSTVFAIDAADAKDISKFSTFPDEQEVVLMPGTRLRAKCQSLNFEGRFFLVHLEEENPQSESLSKSNDLFEQIRQQYQRNNRIERIMNPAKSFPIEQDYINLTIVKAKEQHEKEKQLCNAQHGPAIMGTFEEIYGSKTAIDVKDIFETCKNQEKQVLVFGRAGIGKSTFCQYIAYQWARGSYWSQYELLALIPLRCLTVDRYPPDKSYALIDLVKNEVFQYDLTEKDEILLKKQFDPKKTLWILDGYDEIVQNVPPHLKRLFEQLLRTPHHILTSRPYLNTLSYDVQMEITGFTDDNIVKYVQQFFDKLKDELDNALIKSQKLLGFLKSNTSIWGVAHIPVNLELICSIWSNEDFSETNELTITSLYTMMTEWLCRRYLAAQNVLTQKIPKKEVYRHCQKELSFLESLAFTAMESNSIVIRPAALEKAFDEANVSLRDHPHILNTGILKCFNKQGTGTHIETEKDHYFLHLSFQEYFAARYLINALKGSQTEKVVEFIKHQKYNQRYALVFSFAAGLLSAVDTKICLNIFWNNILGEPLDLVGIRHMQLVISCIEETSAKSTIPQCTKLLEWIANCCKNSFFTKDRIISNYLLQSLQRAQSVVCDQTILKVFINLLQCTDSSTKATVLSFISKLKIPNPSITFITSVTTRLDDKNKQVRTNACKALENMGEKVATNEVISKLVSALEDEDAYVRENACKALGKMGENAATNEVITKLLSPLGDKSSDVRENVCDAPVKVGEKTVTNEVIVKVVSTLAHENQEVTMNPREADGNIDEKALMNPATTKLMSALGDESAYIRANAYKALGDMDKKAMTSEVISKVVSGLGDESSDVRRNACNVFMKMGEKAATHEVINRLVNAVGNPNSYARANACRVLGKLAEKAPSNEVISKLVSALQDGSAYVRANACEALGNMGEKAATNEVIRRLPSRLEDDSEYVRRGACNALGNMGQKAATNKVISMLKNAREDENARVRQNACNALGKMGEIAASNNVVGKVVSALGDEREFIRGNACEALVELGEREATNKVISNLVNALENSNEEIRRNACYVLWKMGKKAATNEVICKLLSTAADESEYVRGDVCKAFGKMGEKAFTDEVISKLVSGLGDASKYVRWNACEALWKMGEKGATNAVMTKLMSALEGGSAYVKASVCYVLGNMGEKVATNEMINSLASALEDQNDEIRWNACKALGKMGEKAAINEVVSKLVSALGDNNEYVRVNACKALGNMGEKARTNEVISKLVSALGDENEEARRNACEALGKIGETAARIEVISKLLTGLGYENKYVRRNACKALGMIGENAATDEVINNLASALEDKSDEVRWNACKALGKMGEKAARNEVVSKLVSALGDNKEYVRVNACEALVKMSEKGARNEVISKLVSALGHENKYVRWYVSKTLGKMGEKAATNEVISGLVNALGDDSEEVRGDVCKALRNMGEKTATNEVIRKLASGLEDEREYVRLNACKAVEKMGVKAATNEVISKLMSTLGDESGYVRKNACKALGNMGEKAATNEVISELARIKNADESMNSYVAAVTVGNILRSTAVITQLDPTIIASLCLYQHASECLKSASEDELIKFFLSAQKPDMLLSVTYITLLKGGALTAFGDKVVVYGSKEPLELSISNSELAPQLFEAFLDQRKRLHLYFEMR